MPPQAVLLDTLTVPGQPTFLHAVREFVAHVLGDGCACGETAVLLTSELVANSVQHSSSRHPGGTITVVVIGIADGRRIEVIDNGGTTVPALKTADEDSEDLAEDGRGLQMVEMLSARWGTYSDAAGTVTWFELAEPSASD
jgi:anti-sigma regulatory factor (Ser/Thr protein kinase)